MKSFKFIILKTMFFLFSVGIVNAQEVSLDIVESLNGCGLATDCSTNFLCFDIRMTVDIDKDLDSYNIWVQYDNTVLSRINGGDDNSCIIANGGDTDIEDAAGAYRVAGIPGSPYPMTAGVQEIVHTICFNVLDTLAVNGTTLSVGGSLFGGALPTSITFADGSTDAVPEVTPLVLSETTISCLVLPVEFLSFNVSKLDRKDILLEWTTLTEINNDRFEIQRSLDGINFKTIGMVKGSGNTYTQQMYSYVDNLDIAIRSSNIYYRLKQFDFDGSYDYSEIKAVKLDEEKTISIYPNPVVMGSNVNITGTYEVAKVIDIYGAELMAFSNKEILNTSMFAKGVYFIIFDEMYTEKFIVIE